MIINCDVCDTRKLQEGAYEAYDEVMINADYIFVNERSKMLLEKLGVTCNADEFIETDSDAAHDIPVVSINGAYRIGKSVSAEDDLILCPESLSSHLSRIVVNGHIIIYPDEYTLLKSNFVIDKYFPLCASEGGKYFVRNTVRLLDKAVDVAQLVKKSAV